MESDTTTTKKVINNDKLQIAIDKYINSTDLSEIYDIYNSYTKIQLIFHISKFISQDVLQQTKTTIRYRK